MTNPLEEGKGEGQPEDPEGSEGTTAKEGTSTVDLSDEDNGSVTNPGKADDQDGQNAAHPDANFTQGKTADTIVDPVKPSGPSATDAG